MVFGNRLRSTGLSNGEKDVKEFGNEGKGVGWFVSSKSVAGCLFNAVEGSQCDWQTPVISNWTLLLQRLYQGQDVSTVPHPCHQFS